MSATTNAPVQPITVYPVSSKAHLQIANNILYASLNFKYGKFKGFSVALAYSGDTPAGVVIFSTINGTDSHVKIDHIAVDAHYRRRGAATKLVEFVEDRAKKVFTVPYALGVQFWQAAGYQPDATMPGFVSKVGRKA